MALIGLSRRVRARGGPHRAPRIRPARSLSVAAAYVRFILSIKRRMSTTCSIPRVPAVAGDLSKGSDDPPTPSAESLCSGEIDTVEHDIVRPMSDCRERARLPVPSQSRDGLPCPTDCLIKTINEPKTSQGLTTEYEIPTVGVAILPLVVKSRRRGLDPSGSHGPWVAECKSCRSRVPA